MAVEEMQLEISMGSTSSAADVAADAIAGENIDCVAAHSDADDKLCQAASPTPCSKHGNLASQTLARQQRRRQWRNHQRRFGGMRKGRAARQGDGLQPCSKVQ